MITRKNIFWLLPIGYFNVLYSTHLSSEGRLQNLMRESIELQKAIAKIKEDPARESTNKENAEQEIKLWITLLEKNGALLEHLNYLENNEKNRQIKEKVTQNINVIKKEYSLYINNLRQQTLNELTLWARNLKENPEKVKQLFKKE